SFRKRSMLRSARDTIPPRLRDLATRIRPSDANSLPPSKIEGAGNAGCALHPRSRVPRIAQLAHTSIQVSGNTPTSPAQRLYGLLRALPGGAGLLSPSPPRSLLLRNLAPASRRQDHTTSPYAAEHSPLDRRVHRIPRPTCRDDGDTPLWWARDDIAYNSDFQKCKANIFANSDFSKI